MATVSATTPSPAPRCPPVTDTASIEEMVAGARARGYAYLAICDHAGRLRGGRVEEQAERIAELNAGLDGFRSGHAAGVVEMAGGEMAVGDRPQRWHLGAAAWAGGGAARSRRSSDFAIAMPRASGMASGCG